MDLSNIYFTFLERINIGVLILDADSNYIYFNDAYCELNNDSRSFFENKSINEFKRIGYLQNSVYEQVMEKGTTISSVITIANQKWNHTYDTLTTGIPCFDTGGKIEYVFILQETLDHLNARLQFGMLNKSVRVFTGKKQPPVAIDIIAESPQMQELISLCNIVAKTDASVLIYGDSGTGKEVIANYIHKASHRNNAPFVAINCASIPENLIESELFGYEKGAFSGASAAGKKGLIEASDGGTLFLDEINSIPLSLQAKLLRVLETKQITRVGAVLSKSINFRLVCASNENLQNLIDQKAFRSDLLYRINVVSITIPPLKERPEDILPLINHFLRQYCHKYKCVKILSSTILKTLQNYDWPGNVRELKNVIERLIITSPQSEIHINHMPSNLLSQQELLPIPPSANRQNPPLSAPAIIYDDDFSLRHYMNACEKQLLEETLKQYGTPAAAAKVLKIDISNVYRKMYKYHILL